MNLRTIPPRWQLGACFLAVGSASQWLGPATLVELAIRNGGLMLVPPAACVLLFRASTSWTRVVAWPLLAIVGWAIPQMPPGGPSLYEWSDTVIMTTAPVDVIMPLLIAAHFCRPPTSTDSGPRLFYLRWPWSMLSISLSILSANAEIGWLAGGAAGFVLGREIEASAARAPIETSSAG